MYMRGRIDEPCVKDAFHTLAMRGNLPQHGSIPAYMCYCNRTHAMYSIHQVPHTNLMLLAVDAGCPCDIGINPVDPVEVIYNDTLMCERLQTEIYRKRPDACYSTHELEDPSDCGADSASSHPSSLVVILFFTLCSVSQWH